MVHPHQSSGTEGDTGKLRIFFHYGSQVLPSHLQPLDITFDRYPQRSATGHLGPARQLFLQLHCFGTPGNTADLNELPDVDKETFLLRSLCSCGTM